MTVAVLWMVSYSAKSYSILCHLLEAVYQSSRQIFVCISTLLDINISETSGPIATRFYLDNYKSLDEFEFRQNSTTDFGVISSPEP